MNENAIVAVVGDGHCNSTVGLYNPATVLLGERPHDPTPFQVKLWEECWLDFWGRVAQKKAQLHYPVIVVFVGDMIDKAPKVGKLISPKLTVAVGIGEWALEPAVEVADILFMVSGTDFHVGSEGDFEDILAMSLGAEPDLQARKPTWQHLQANWGGLLWDICHHPATTWHRPWTKLSAIAREGDIVATRCLKAGQPVPDIVIRAHVHSHGSHRSDIPPAVYICHPWEMTSAYGYRRSHTVPQGAGGYIFVIEDRDWHKPTVTYPPQRREPWSRAIAQKASPSRRRLAKLMSHIRGLKH